MTLSVVQDLILLLAAGFVAAFACRAINVSVLIGYLVVGTMIGQGALGWIEDENHQLAHFTELGVFLLLFSIGLEFSIDDLKRLGRRFVIGGGTQMLLVAVPVSVLLVVKNVSWQAAVLISSALAFSSTVLVFRALSEVGHTQHPHGRRAIGILLFQDAALIPLLLTVPLLTGHQDAAGLTEYVRLAISTVAFFLAIFGLRHALGEWIVPLFAAYRSTELIVLFMLASLGGITLAAHAIGLPPTIGAFAAGLIFNGNRWSHQIDALVLPFREAFAAVFFVGLGLIFDPQLIWREPSIVFLFLPMLMALKAIAATTALRFTGLSMPTSFGMGIGLAHVGEFAFVLVLMGVDTGVLSEQDYQRVVALAVGSLLFTPALIKLGLRMIASDSEETDTLLAVNVHSGQREAVVIGAGPIGCSVASQLETIGTDVCLVDLSPLNLHHFAQLGFRTTAGDATQDTTLTHARIGAAQLIVVCLPDDQIANRVVRSVRKHNPSAQLIVRCRYQSNIKKLKRSGADEVVAEENEAALALLRIVAQNGDC